MIDLSYYDGEDRYSDGDVEDDLLDIVKRGENIENVLARDNRWATLCHLSPNRRNLLEWYPFEPAKNLLEIGAGCGALTGLFCERTDSVTAVELSKKRAEIIETRHRQHENLRIIVANLDDLTLSSRFDYVTLIGVLEYADRFMESADPHLCLLKKATAFLKPGGTLFLAIENALGMKYFAGAAEDHLGNFFSSVEGYPELKRKMTFGRKELLDMASRAGFRTVNCYYPIPDYKLPDAIFSDDHLPSLSDLLSVTPNYDRDRLVLFNERLASETALANDVFPVFSNSFLLICEK